RQGRPRRDRAEGGPARDRAFLGRGLAARSHRRRRRERFADGRPERRHGDARTTGGGRPRRTGGPGARRPDRARGGADRRRRGQTGPGGGLMPQAGGPTGTRLLLRRLRDVMAGGGSAQDRLNKIVSIVAADMVAEVCSAYVM